VEQTEIGDGSPRPGAPAKQQRDTSEKDTAAAEKGEKAARGWSSEAPRGGSNGA